MNDKTAKKIFILLPLLFFLAVVKILSLPPEVGADIAMDIPAFSVDGLATSDLGKEFAIINFFASWCAPCAAEIPVLKKIADQKIPVYGIDSLDNPGDLDLFLKKHGNPFTKIGSDAAGAASVAWNVTGVPVSLVIADGRIFHRFDGPLTEMNAEAIINTFKKRHGS